MSDLYRPAATASHLGAPEHDSARMAAPAVAAAPLAPAMAGLSAEQALLLCRRAMESCVNGIVIADATDGNLPLIYVNPAFERITGYGAAEVLGRNCRFLQRGDVDMLQELDRLRSALAAGTDVQAVLRNYRKDGTPFWNELSISPVSNADGAVTHFVGIQNDVTERRARDTEHLRRLTHDALTGLPNRALLLDRLRQALAASPHSGRAAALLHVNLDHFKEINDELGHDAGDQVLLEVAHRLGACLRPGDTLARLDGDEFVVMLPDLALPANAACVGATLLAAVGQPYVVAGKTLFCGCSIGVSHATSPNDEPLTLLKQADRAMGEAKRAGRNNVQFYFGDMAARVPGRLELRSKLQVAIAREEFVLHFQPQLDLATRRICGVEALVRWQHPIEGQISPAHFISVAEDTGQIVQIGEWVMNEACRQHGHWLAAGLLDCPVAVNVSGVQFERAGFVETVQAALARQGLAGERLELELTESVMMDPGGTVLAKLTRLREMGVRLSIDDFGTGFSSLAYLKRLPIDKVKIDRSFVNDITHDSKDASIALSIIAIAHNLRLRVVAEGVETAAQLAYLRRNQCDEVQGYFVAHPMPGQALEAFLRGFCPPGDEASLGERAGPTLLLVDDDPDILRALTHTLQRDGCRILTAGGAAEAYELLAANDVQVIVSDQRMPRLCGTDFLSEVKTMYPNTVRLVLSGCADLASVTEAINRGAIYRFLTKPWVGKDMRDHVREAFAHHQRQSGPTSRC